MSGFGLGLSLLLVATLLIEAQLAAGALDPLVVADEELVDQHLLRVRLGHLGEHLAVGRAYVASVHRDLHLG